MTGHIDRRLAELKIEAAECAVAGFEFYAGGAERKSTFRFGPDLPLERRTPFRREIRRRDSAQQGQEAARLCALNLLAQAKRFLAGDLDRIVRVLRLCGFVNGTPEFGDQPKVLNGASDVMVEVFGDAGRHSRTAVGAAALPGGVAVEIEAVFELR